MSGQGFLYELLIQGLAVTVQHGIHFAIERQGQSALRIEMLANGGGYLAKFRLCFNPPLFFQQLLASL